MSVLVKRKLHPLVCVALSLPLIMGWGLELHAKEATTLWCGSFESDHWLKEWHVRREKSWGWQNIEIRKDPDGMFSKILRVHYPRGSAAHGLTQNEGAPVGGVQFLSDLGVSQNVLHLKYYLRFPEDFHFAKGGELPGLFGGDDIHGFSTHLVWRRGGTVGMEVTTTDGFKVPSRNSSSTFKPGQWQFLEEEIHLNTPGESDGRIRVRLDGQQVFEQEGVALRNEGSAKINGVLFSTYFGGNEASSATPQSTYVDFANFVVDQ